MMIENFYINGTVLNQKTRQGISGLRVEAWDKDLIFNDMVGSAITDETGSFRIEFSEGHFRECFLDRKPDLFFKVYRGEELLKNTKDSVLWNMEAGETKIVIEVDIEPVIIEPILDKKKLLELKGVSRMSPKELEKTHPDLFAYLVNKVNLQVKENLLALFKDSSEELKEEVNTFEIRLEMGKEIDLKDQIITYLKQKGNSEKVVKEAETLINEARLPRKMEDILHTEIPVNKNRLFIPELDKAKLYYIGDIAGLDESKVEILIRKASRPALLNDTSIKSMVESGDMDDQKAKELGLTTGLFQLLDDDAKLTETLKNETFPQIAKGKVEQIKDLVAFEKNDWLAVLKKANCKPPDGMGQEEYARLISKKIENIYPTDTFWARIMLKDTKTLSKAVKRLQPLFDKNTAVFNVSSFENLNIGDINRTEKEKLSKAHSELKNFANMYPGMGIIEILDDRELSPDEKTEGITKRVDMLKRFREKNENLELLKLDYTAGSADLEKLDFQGLSQDEGKMILATVKAHQRVYSVTKDVDNTRLLLGKGYYSAASIAHGTVDAFKENTGLSTIEAQEYFNVAQEISGNSSIWLLGLMDLLYGGFQYFKVGNIGQTILDYLKEFDGLQDLFGRLAYCKCKHCQSILSPAAYFVDLMHFVEEHVLNRHFSGDREEHVLNLKMRRPDLWEILLTCQNTYEILPYLDIINPVLENYIAKCRGFSGSLSTTDRSPVERFVYGLLYEHEELDSFRQPFSLPLEKLNIYLSHFNMSRERLASILDAPSDVHARTALGLSAREYALITSPNTNVVFLQGLYHCPLVIPAGSTVVTKFDAQLLLKPMGLSRSELGEMVSTKFVTDDGRETIRIVSEKFDEDSIQNDIERINGLRLSSLDRMHRFTRLWRRLSWTIAELDLVLSHIDNEGLSSGLEASALEHLANLLSIKERFGISVEELCALWSTIPRTRVYEEKDSLFNRLFNLPEFVLMDERFPKNSVEFIHPSFRSPDSAPPADNVLHRLLAGLQSGDDELYLLLIHLSDPLGIDLSSEREADKGFNLTVENLSLLYRHRRLAKLLRLRIPELFQLISLSGGIPSGYIRNLDDLSSLLEFYDWWKATDFSMDELGYISGGEILNPETFPDENELCNQILETIIKDNALTFADTVFAFLEGVTEEQSRIVVSTNRAGIQKTPDGTAFWLTEVFRITDSRLPFADTLFSYLDGVSEEDSRAIIAANGAFIEAAPPYLAAYRLSDAFEPTVSLNIPGGISATEAEVKALLTAYYLIEEADGKPLLFRYYSTEVIPTYLSGILGISKDKTRGLIYMAGFDLRDPVFTSILQGTSTADELIELIKRVLVLSILFKNKGFDADSVNFISRNLSIFDIPGDFNDISVPGIQISIPSIQRVSIYHSFLKTGDDEKDHNNNLRNVLDGFDNTTGHFSANDLGKLAQILGAEIGLTSTMQENISLPITPLEALKKLSECVEAAQYIGVSAEALRLIISDDYGDLVRASDAVFGAFRAKYDDEEKWKENVEPFENKIRSRKRDALTDFLIHSIHPEFKTLHDLYYYFLLDVELEGCARTSKLVAAISSVQLYVHRCLMNLEQDSRAPGTPGRVHVLPEDIPQDEWEWRKNYRVWEANRKVFLYPENYIEPDLRDNKTPLFKDLESKLLQQDINEQTVLDAYANYMKGFEEIAKLKIAGVYHDISKKIGEETDIMHLFGVTPGDPLTYYYRIAENLYYGEKEDTCETHGIIWSPWQRIDIQIPAWKVAPIVFSGRLYVFWVEITTQPENEVTDEGSEFTGYKHKMSLKFTTLRLDGTWTPPQVISLRDPIVFYAGAGIIRDPIDPDIKKPWLRCTDPSSNKETMPIHTKPIDDYSPTGYKWEQVYPETMFAHPEFEKIFTITGFPTVNINGTSPLVSQFSRSVDFYEKKINPNPIGHTIAERDLYGRFNSKFLCAKTIDPESGWIPLYYRIPPTYPPSETYVSYYALASVFIYGRRLLDLDSDWPDRYVENIINEFNQGPIIDINLQDKLSVVNGSLEDVIIDSNGDLLLLQGSIKNGTEYLLKRLGTTLSEEISRKLFTEGIEGFLDTKHQEALEEAQLSIIKYDEFITDLTKAGDLDFEGPYGVYYREIFFHIPFLIANHLNSQQKFAEAQKWYHYIFNPTSSEVIPEDDPDLSPEDRNWRYREFRELTAKKLREQLADKRAIETYKKDPFNPHAIARLRLSAYQKAIVMKYIDNLLDWGDHLFTEDTMESINEATLLYVMASDILGERPPELGDCDEGNIEKKNYMYISEFFKRNPGEEWPDFITEMEHLIRVRQSDKVKTSAKYDYVIEPIITFSASVNATSYLEHFPTSDMNPTMALDGVFEEPVSEEPDEAPITMINKPFRPTWKEDLAYAGSNPYPNFILSIQEYIEIIPLFCVPPNEELLSYWDRVEDRLFKIRNCMNISGVRREISLFAPEISPMLLVRAREAGLSMEDVLNAISGNLPPYRFTYLIEKAKGYASMVQGFGSALLSALEKKDTEELNLLRTVHQQNLLKLTKQVRNDEYNAAVETHESLVKRKETVELRRDQYQDLLDKGLTPWEKTQSAARHTASILRGGEAAFAFLSATLHLIPQTGSPFAMKYGGLELGKSAHRVFTAIEACATMADNLAASAGLEAGFDRRKQGWGHQLKLANSEINQLEKQIEAARIRKEIAKQSIEVFEQTVKQQDELYEFYNEKFSNLGLYTWLSTNLQRLYKEAYNNAYSMAKLAEQAYRFERGDDGSELIGSSHWEPARAGFLSGESLFIDLQNMEKRFVETNYRRLEIDQSFSLTQINPGALIQLKETGICEFGIPELFFDLFYPGHYRRKIKAVRLTIPCITGPYTNVSATLSLLGSKIRNEPKEDESDGTTYLLDVPLSRSISIATSTAQNDAGVFELNFRDERYMPFEGAGAISVWKLSLPKNFRQFDYQTINDVIIHISYTAEEDSLFRERIEELNASLEGTLLNILERPNALQRTFSFRQEFSSQFNRLLHTPVESSVNIEFEILDKHFPIFLKGRELRIDRAVLILRTPKVRRPDGILVNQSVNGFIISINENDIGEFGRQDEEWGELPFKDITIPLVFSGGILGRHTIAIESPGDLVPDSPSTSDLSVVDSEKLTDIYLYLEYGIT